MSTQVYKQMNSQVNQQFQLINQGKQPLNVICIFLWNLYNLNIKLFLSIMLTGWLSPWRNRSFILGRQKDTLSKNHRRSVTSRPDRNPHMGYQLLCKVPAFHWVMIGLWGFTVQHVEHLCQRTPACHQAGHTYIYTQHTALGPLKRGGEGKWTRKKNLSKRAHTRGWSWGAGYINIPTSILKNDQKEIKCSHRKPPIPEKQDV